MLVSHTQLLLQLNDVALEKPNDGCTSHSRQPVTWFPGICFQALPRCVHRIRRAVCSSASVWASSLQPRPGRFRSWGGITNSAVRMMAAANAASTSSTFLSPGGFALRCLPTAVEASSCRSWGSVTRRLRSTGGLADTLSRRFRAKWPRSLTGADTMLLSEIRTKEGWGCTVTFRTICDHVVSLGCSRCVFCPAR